MGNRLARWYFGKKEARILFVGLDAAGKTTILYKLKLGEVVTTIPTIGFNVETVEHKDRAFTVMDVGLRGGSRPLMRHYFHDTNALIMVVDSNDEGRLGDAKSELVWLLAEDELRGVPVLVLANKQDLARSLTVEEVAERLDLRSINDRPSRILGSVALTGDGLREGLDWLVDALSGQYMKQHVAGSLATSIGELQQTLADDKKHAYGLRYVMQGLHYIKGLTGCSKNDFTKLAAPAS